MKNLGISLLTFLLSAPAFAVDTPRELAGATVVSAEDARDLVGSGVKIYDVRVATEYVEEHIPGSISLPYKEKSKKEAGFDGAQDKFNLAAITSGKDKGVIFQCNGADCWKSYKASVMAIKDGFKKVYWFRGGLPEWKQKGFAVEK